VRVQVALARNDIRYLETELGARASMRQLERWNAEDFRYSVPSAQQYLQGERALASLEGIQPNGPTYVAPPVMTAMVETPKDLPAAAQAATTPSPAATQIRSDISIIRTAQAADKVDDLPKPKVKVAEAKPSTEPSQIARKAERMAMLDARLLDDRTLGDLSAKAAAERKKEKR
jgi:hypothetical protein